jgi:hypothetical protein
MRTIELGLIIGDFEPRSLIAMWAAEGDVHTSIIEEGSRLPTVAARSTRRETWR